MRKIKNQNDMTVSRRRFLKICGGGAVLTQTSLISTLINLQLSQSAAAGVLPDYKALVCVFLHGGNDSYNMLVPTDADAYAAYQQARGVLALDLGALQSNSIVDPTDGRNYGIHPDMPELQQLYDAEKLAFVANMGPLVQPVTLEDYINGSALLPVGLFSHSDQQRHWQTAKPQERAETTGWVGRIADIREDSTNSNPYVPMNIALHHLNILQNGDNAGPYVINENGAVALWGYNKDNAAWKRILTQATDAIHALPYDEKLPLTYSEYFQRTLNTAAVYNDATAPVDIGDIEFPGEPDDIGKQLEQVARAIGAHENLGQTRQIFFTEQGGYDHHHNLLNSQAVKLPILSQSLKAFQDAMVELQLEQDVVLFTISDFGRTLSTNGDGSDHGWGGNSIVMGGPVQGGQLYGQYPESLALGNDLDVGRGRLIPTTSVDEYNAELALWFGILNNAELESVLPNIRTFYSDTATTPPLGFLG